LRDRFLIIFLPFDETSPRAVFVPALHTEDRKGQFPEKAKGAEILAPLGRVGQLLRLLFLRKARLVLIEGRLLPAIVGYVG
jgi:hypothetical protein